MKKLIFATVCLALMLSLCSCAELFGGATYELSEDGTYAEVVGYNPSYKRISVASEYKGVPVKVIASRAFENGYNIKSVKIAASVTEIGNEAFLDCESLESVKFAANSNLTTIGDAAFGNCKRLRNVEIPESVTKIGNGAFSHCESFSEIRIPDSVVEVGGRAFAGCSRTTSIEIGTGVTAIDIFTFSGCARVESLSISLETELDLPIAGLFGESLKTVTVTGGTEITDGAFENCTNITSITLPNSLTIIGEKAFANSGITSITIPEGVTHISASAFYECRNLSVVVLPSTITSTCANAFYFCYALTTVYYGGTAEEWAGLEIESSSKLAKATIHYYSESAPKEEGNFWHFDDNGNAVAW